MHVRNHWMCAIDSYSSQDFSVHMRQRVCSFTFASMLLGRHVKNGFNSFYVISHYICPVSKTSSSVQKYMYRLSYSTFSFGRVTCRTEALSQIEVSQLQ